MAEFFPMTRRDSKAMSTGFLPSVTATRTTTFLVTGLCHLLHLLLLLLSSPAAEAQPLQPLSVDCFNTAGNYTANSTYETNLNFILGSLKPSVTATTIGFYSSASTGTAPDMAHALVLCRGDVPLPSCQDCLATALREIQELCPHRKSAIIWYDYCLLRYSHQRIVSVLDSNYMLYIYNASNVSATEVGRFNRTVVELLDGLTEYAAYNASAPPPSLFATGEIPFSRVFEKIYGLVQCTRDLSRDDCNKCLRGIIEAMLSCCPGSIEMRVLGLSCNFRYRVYPFYYGSARLSLTPSTNSVTESSDAKRKKNRARVISAIAVPMAITVVLIFILSFCYLKRKRTKRYYKKSQQEIPTIESLLFSLSTIRQATYNFSQSSKLGQGGFGAVYKGTLPDGIEIAAKRLSADSGQGIDELKNEVVLLARLQHKNLVRLLGVCLERREKILVYEYVLNRSLDTFLFDRNKKDRLSWDIRYNIIAGIARGLRYLHEESQIKIIHRDLKASNILLDANMEPKISDFGLARLFGGDQSEANTSRVVGTFGYMSPEYVLRGHFSNKSDVFSFGVIVLELVSGRKRNAAEDSSDLLSYVWEHWCYGTLLDALDPCFRSICPQNEVLRCIQIGLLCVQEAPAERPTMSSVVSMLNSQTASLQVPSQPAFISTCKRGECSEGSSHQMSVTQLEPR